MAAPRDVTSLKQLVLGRKDVQDLSDTEADARVPSLAELWPAFNWQERETFDMYGIHFDGHPDLRRVYMYDEFVGYPLRKDYPKEKRQPLVRRDDLPINPIKAEQK